MEKERTENPCTVGGDENVNINLPPNPPPYPTQQPQEVPDPLGHPMGPVPPMPYGAASPMPIQYQGYYVPSGAQGPILQMPQAAYFTPVQPAKEPDFLTYSILSMVLCCIPLGIVALVFSIKTRKANETGNFADAKKYSRKAGIYANVGFRIGVALTVFWITMVVLQATTRVFYISSSP